MRCLLMDWMRALLKRVVGDQADLPAGEADGLVALGMDGHGHQGDCDLLAGGQELVHLALRRGDFLAVVGADLRRQVDQIIRGVAHGADDDDDLMPGCLGQRSALARQVDAACVGDAGAAKLLND